MTREEATERLNRCREILEFTSHMDNQTRKAFDMAIKALEHTGWIPVSEKLPEPQKSGSKDYSDWVQITVHAGKDYVIGNAYYCFADRQWYTVGIGMQYNIGNDIEEVTAWKPLPKPYMKESEG